MTKTILTLSVLLLTIAAFCTERETIRDAHEKVVGTATTDGNKTVYRDVHGGAVYSFLFSAFRFEAFMKSSETPS